MTGARLMLALPLALAAFAAPSARADTEPQAERLLFTRFALGGAFDYERWHPDGGSPGASTTGWGPALDVSVGRRVRPGLVIAGDYQLAAIVNRTQRYLGASYDLADTLHLLHGLGVLADYAPASRRWLHFGGGLGALAASDIDTDRGGRQTHWGWLAAVHAAVEQRLSARWSVGVLGRLTFYRFGSDTPAPASSSTGVVPTLLATFALR